MHSVFEPNALELADLGGDTHFVTEVQSQTKKYLEGDSALRNQIQQGLMSLGPRAVPGVLSAAFAFNHQLKAKRSSHLLGELLALLVDSNLAARALLVRNIVEAPFATTRATVLHALHQLGNIRSDEFDLIRECARDNAYKNEDHQSALMLYSFLIDQGDEQCCSEVRLIAVETFGEYLDNAPRYLDLALRCSPQNTYDILVETMGDMDRTAKEFGKEIGEMSAASVSNLPEVLRAAHTIKEDSVGFAHKGIQNLFTGPIRKLFSESPSRIAESGDLIRERYLSLARFFWQCLGMLLKSRIVQEYFAEQTSGLASEFALKGVVQLIYTKENGGRFKLWASELLETIEMNSPQNCANAYREYERGRPTEDTTGKRSSKVSGLE
ncbi:MAG: hypothetical protein JW892_16255 [Anaerolineae bacterium]|nr:hypothetical protein [Anaerolineae bacterium]